MLMTRPLRIQLPGELYHITARGNAQQSIFLNKDDVNKKYQRAGHLLQGRFKSILIDKENYLLGPSRYIFLNSQRANLVEDPKDWPWSSYSQFIGINKGIPCLATDWITSLFASDRKTALKAYQVFILKREIKVCQANQDYGYSLTEIAKHLGIHYTTVSKIIKRMEN